MNRAIGIWDVSGSFVIDYPRGIFRVPTPPGENLDPRVLTGGFVVHPVSFRIKTTGKGTLAGTTFEVYLNT